MDSNRPTRSSVQTLPVKPPPYFTLAGCPPTPPNDASTLLHLFGLDHRRLAYKRNAMEMTLTDGQPARVVEGLLA